MIVDARVYLGDSLYGRSHTADALLAQMERLAIDLAVAVPAKPHDYHLGPANDAVAAAARHYPQRLRWLCRVDPWQGTAAVAEARRGMEELGAAGLYLDPWEENFQVNDSIVYPLIEEARRCGKPVLLNAGHVRVSHPTQVRDLASRFPDVQFVASNGGQINISGILQAEARRMLEACPNVCIETAGTYRQDYLEEIATEVGVDRVLFASGSPHYDQEFELARVALAKLGDDLKARLRSGNAMAVYAPDHRPSW